MRADIRTTDGSTISLPHVVKVKKRKGVLTITTLVDDDLTDKFKLPTEEVKKFKLVP